MFHCPQAVQNDACHKIMHLAAMSSKVAHSDLESTINTIGWHEWHHLMAVQSQHISGNLGAPFCRQWWHLVEFWHTITCNGVFFVLCQWYIKLTLTTFVIVLLDIVCLNLILCCIYASIGTQTSSGQQLDKKTKRKW